MIQCPRMRRVSCFILPDDSYFEEENSSVTRSIRFMRRPPGRFFFPLSQKILFYDFTSE